MENVKKIEGITRLQKVGFLLDIENSMGFDFKKSNYGPFSSRLFEIMETVNKDNLINEEVINLENNRKKYIYEIQPKGLYIFKRMQTIYKKTDTEIKIRGWIEFIKLKKFNKKQLPNLIKYVYTKYPDFAGDFFKKQ